jgi:regulator of sigma E protease
MTMTLTSLFAFILAIGILVTIHEFGHFWVARKAGVKVLRFSVGFGQPLWKRTAKDGVEYVLAAIPLGGYVKMLDEREGDVADDELDQAFNRQSVWKRIAIVAAGPIANLLLAIVITTIVFLIGLPAERPYLAEPVANTPAALAGVQEGDQVLAINDVEVKSWDQARMTFLDEYLKNESRVYLSLKSDNAGLRNVTLDLGGQGLLKEEGDFLEKTGLVALRAPSKVSVAEVMPNSAAEKAGFQAGDRFLRVNGEPVKHVYALIDDIKENKHQLINFVIAREHQGQIEEIEMPTVIGERKHEGKVVGSLGAKLQSEYTPEIREKFVFLDRSSFGDALLKGVEGTWQMAVVTLKAIGKMLMGEASLKNISGPITIADLAGKTLAADVIFYLKFLAIISVSIGILNLLPIPMLDGGHLLYYSIELVTGKPVPEKVEAIGFQIGIMLVACMMMLAIYNDITRLIN